MSSAKPTDYGFFGPDYSVANDIKLPGELGVRQESSFQAIFDSVGGVNYYLDTIAFGSATGFDKGDPYPLGIRYYLDTGLKCSNGATMHEYVDGVTRGDLLGERVAKGLASAGLPGMRGLAPGLVENAVDALDPRPIFSAVTGTGYPVCQQVSCPVGTSKGSIVTMDDPLKPFIIGDVSYKDGMAMQKRWVQGYNDKGGAISISKDEFSITPKCYNPDGSYMARPPDGCPQAPPGLTGDTKPKGKRYKNCTLVTPVSLPPTMQGPSVQPFTDYSEPTSIVNVAGIITLSIALAAITYSFYKSRK